MGNVEAQVAMSELEKIEFNRRSDIAYSVVLGSVRLFNQLTDLDEQIKRGTKAASSYWYWIFFLIGAALHFFLSESSSGINLGWWISIAVLSFYCLKRYEIEKLEVKRSQCEQRLYELEVVWNGVVGHVFFWEIRNFAHESVLDPDAQAFLDWWTERQSWILIRICGYEKASLLEANANSLR